eukprot:TRINITY_DN3422_c0_g1_i1.p2 TRINITY_DN3422_c0_g1~~TRINITY_DN3422_c0_g1_i1.p2  ORF type:complete len:318 (-),score=63.68 TRINITY_DN3422_c0_g1_i1:97-1050(-)
MAELAALKKLVEAKDREIAKLNEKLLGEQGLQLERQQLENEIKLLKSLSKDLHRENVELKRNLAEYDNRDDQYTSIHDLSVCKDQEIASLKKEIKALQKIISEKDKALMQTDRDVKPTNKIAVDHRLLQAEVGQLRVQKKQTDKQLAKAKQTITTLETRLHYITIALKRCGKELYTTDGDESVLQPTSPNAGKKKTEKPQWCGPKDPPRRSHSASSARKGQTSEFAPLPSENGEGTEDHSCDMVPAQVFQLLQADYAKVLREMEEIRNGANRQHALEVSRLHDDLRKLDQRYKRDLGKLKAELGVETAARAHQAQPM